MSFRGGLAFHFVAKFVALQLAVEIMHGPSNSMQCDHTHWDEMHLPRVLFILSRVARANLGYATRD